MIYSFRQYVVEKRVKQSGQDAGSYEVDKTGLETARELVEKFFGEPVENVIPNFDENYKLAVKLDKIGRTKRADMPVIEDYQVKELQRKLQHGSLDVKKPFADKGNPFPEGLTGEDAHEFLLKGFHDKKLRDDIIKVTEFSESAKNLKPIQKQIYLDKCLSSTAQFGVEGTKAFLKKSLMIKSKDNYIIDGHHRWMSALLIDPDLKMVGISIDLPIKELLPLTKSYGDALGNKRNK